jgi:hypothetical protein
MCAVAILTSGFCISVKRSVINYRVFKRTVFKKISVQDKWNNWGKVKYNILKYEGKHNTE